MGRTIPNADGAAVDIEELEQSEAAATAGRIYCANCIHCKLVPTPADGEGRYRLRVRCDAGKWRKKLGEEKIYKYFTVARRSIPSCDSYEDMGEAAEFMKDLKEILPTADEIYSS
ncbi:MAG TPA: hypothetical protein VMC79_02410 [Rectinemataceae bacterium]|nr:hypothetical protein [Rectinemataceae bacterium]